MKLYLPDCAPNMFINLRQHACHPLNLLPVEELWVPGEDFLATNPISESPPPGWTDIITNAGAGDGFAIQFDASSPSNDLQPGASLNFGFTSADDPASVNGNSVFYPGTPTSTSFVYSIGPFEGVSDQLVVTPPTLQSIAVTPVNTTLASGTTEQFTATGTLSNDTTESLTSQVTWSSSDTTWATINSAGLATAVSPGPVTISAAFDGITGSTGLTVKGGKSIRPS
jgi:trimeric autotransporter adhesin